MADRPPVSARAATSAGPGPARASGGDSIRRSLSWTVPGELIFAACLWASLMVVAKLGSPEALGRYALGLAVATPVIVLTNLHLRPIYVVDVRSRWRFEHYLALRLFSLPLALVVTAAVCVARGWPWQTAAVVMLLSVIRVAGSVSDILYARAQRAETMAPIGISRALRGTVWIGLLSAGLVWADEVVGLALVALALTLCTLLYDLPKARAIGAPSENEHEHEHEHERARVRPSFDAHALRGLAWTALPAGLAAAVFGVTANVPTYTLEEFHGLAELGFFAAVLSILQASGVINMALGNVAIPRLAKHAASDARKFWRLLFKLLALVFALNGIGLLAVVVAGDLYLRLAYTPQYAAYLPELITAAGAAVVLGLANMLSQTLTALSRFRAQLLINILALGFCVAAAAWLIPARGINGAIETLLALAVFRLLIYLGAILLFGPRRERQARP